VTPCATVVQLLIVTSYPHDGSLSLLLRRVTNSHGVIGKMNPFTKDPRYATIVDADLAKHGSNTTVSCLIMCGCLITHITLFIAVFNYHPKLIRLIPGYRKVYADAPTAHLAPNERHDCLCSHPESTVWCSLHLQV